MRKENDINTPKSAMSGKQDCAMRERAEFIFERKAKQARTEAEGFENLAEIARNADPATEEVLWRLASGYIR